MRAKLFSTYFFLMIITNITFLVFIVLFSFRACDYFESGQAADHTKYMQQKYIDIPMKLPGE